MSDSDVEVCRAILEWYKGLFGRHQCIFEENKKIYLDALMKNYDDFYRHNIPDGIKKAVENMSNTIGKNFLSSFSEVADTQLKMLKMPVLGKRLAKKTIEDFDKSKKVIVPFLAEENVISSEKIDALTKEHVKQDEFCKALTDYLGSLTVKKTKLEVDAEEFTHLILHDIALTKYYEKVFKEIADKETRRIYG